MESSKKKKNFKKSASYLLVGLIFFSVGFWESSLFDAPLELTSFVDGEQRKSSIEPEKSRHYMALNQAAMTHPNSGRHNDNMGTRTLRPLLAAALVSSSGFISSSVLAVLATWGGAIPIQFVVAAAEDSSTPKQLSARILEELEKQFITRGMSADSIAEVYDAQFIANVTLIIGGNDDRFLVSLKQWCVTNETEDPQAYVVASETTFLVADNIVFAAEHLNNEFLHGGEADTAPTWFVSDRGNLVLMSAVTLQRYCRLSAIAARSFDECVRVARKGDNVISLPSTCALQYLDAREVRLEGILTEDTRSFTNHEVVATCKKQHTRRNSTREEDSPNSTSIAFPSRYRKQQPASVLWCDCLPRYLISSPRIGHQKMLELFFWAYRYRNSGLLPSDLQPNQMIKTVFQR